MKRADPVAKTVFTWLKKNLGPDCLSALSGQDWKALQAAVQIVEVWSNSDDRAAVAPAFKLVVEEMQPKCRELAFHAIAHVTDWSYRVELWETAGLEHFTSVRVCAYGPGGKGDAQYAKRAC